MNALKYPVTLRGFLPRCWLFVFRSPVAAIRAMLPASLEPVTHGGFAFWNIVVSEVRNLRWWPLPAFTGLAYWHVGYRIYARARLAAGEEVEGLYFVRSDCDRQIVAWPGNLLTDFRFRVGKIQIQERGSLVEGRIEAIPADASFVLDRAAPVRLAEGTPFVSPEEAATLLKYQPCGLAPSGDRHVQVVRITRQESQWRSRPIHVREARWQFLAEHPATPELCFEVDPIEYQWNRGVRMEVAS